MMLSCSLTYCICEAVLSVHIHEMHAPATKSLILHTICSTSMLLCLRTTPLKAPPTLRDKEMHEGIRHFSDCVALGHAIPAQRQELQERMWSTKSIFSVAPPRPAAPLEHIKFNPPMTSQLKTTLKKVYYSL